MTKFGMHDAGGGPELETRKASAEALLKQL